MERTNGLPSRKRSLLEFSGGTKFSTKLFLSANDVSHARERLMSTLDDVSTRNDSEQNSDTNSDSDAEHSESDANIMRNEIEKIKKKENACAPHILDLLGRKVDMSRFDMDASPFSLCRAWVENKVSVKRDESHAKRDEDGEFTENGVGVPELQKGNAVFNCKPENVHSLPKPTPRIAQHQRRLPQRSSEEQFYTSISQADAPSKGELLMDHSYRWTYVKRECRDYSRQEDSRYAQSEEILSDMFYSSQMIFESN